MIQIGVIAGSIFRCLERKGWVELSELYAQTGFPQNKFSISLGWLVKKGYVSLREDEDGKTYFRDCHHIDKGFLPELLGLNARR